MFDTEDDTTASRRNYLRAAGAVGLASVTGLAGCMGGDGGGATGTLATVVRDAPGDIDDFDSCVITVEGIWLKKASEDDGTDDTVTTDEEGLAAQREEDVDQGDGREYHEYDESQEADLVQLQDGNTKLVDETDVETGTYAFLQLDVSGVDATLKEGGEANVGTPGEAPLQFNEEFDVRDGQRTTFTADFTPVKLGRTGRYLLQPVATGTEVSYEAVTTTE